MKNGPIRSFVLGAIIGVSTLNLAAQTWDAPAQAQGWAKQDKDDSFTFYDPAARLLRTWMRDGGFLGSLSVARLEEPPERWVLDPRGNAWVAHGTSLTLLDPAGRSLEKLRLPAEVGDIGWDAKGFVLSYRTAAPYFEKRDFKGALLWASGTRPPKAEGSAARVRRPITLDDTGNVLLAEGSSLNLAVLEAHSGQKISESTLRLGDGQPAPALVGPTLERASLAIWPGKKIIFAAIPATQIPIPFRGSLQGLVLARIDAATSRLDFLPTGLDGPHLLVGVMEAQAVFVNPRGGLVLVKVQ